MCNFHNIIHAIFDFRAEIVRYYQFLKRYDPIYHDSRPHAEATLLYPPAPRCTGANWGPLPRSGNREGNYSTDRCFSR